MGKIVLFCVQHERCSSIPYLFQYVINFLLLFVSIYQVSHMPYNTGMHGLPVRPTDMVGTQDIINVSTDRTHHLTNKHIFRGFKRVCQSRKIVGGISGTTELPPFYSS